jgi:hypothetical protein
LWWGRNQRGFPRLPDPGNGRARMSLMLSFYWGYADSGLTDQPEAC